jgi:hypothetical protein
MLSARARFLLAVPEPGFGVQAGEGVSLSSAPSLSAGIIGVTGRRRPFFRLLLGMKPSA